MDGQTQNPPLDINQVAFLLTITQGILPLHLSADCSINLSKVIRYEPVEKLDDKEKPTGELVPALIFEGGDCIFLTPEQVEVFRPIWDIYSKISNQIFSLVNGMVASVETSTDQTQVN